MTTVKLSLNASESQQDAPGAIAISHLRASYRDVEALRDIDCLIFKGRLTGIIGPNGAGKSTLMKAMLGLLPTAGGRVLYNGKPLMEQRDAIAYVPQRSLLDWTFPATVWDVVMMGRVKKTGFLRRFSTVSRRIATEALERVGMSDYRDRRIGDLSGGQQQRVFLARSLAQQADIYCFDEPFVGIDQKTQDLIFQIFRELADSDKTVVVVNHDLGASIVNFDDLILLDRELIAWGSRQKVLREENLNRAYGGKVVFFSGEAA